MVRRVAVIYLILATLAGPRLCPCSVSLPEPAPPAPSTPLKAAPRGGGCCALPGLTTWAVTTVSQAAGDQCPDQPSAPCHCQCGKQDTTATVRTVGRVAKSGVDHAGLDATLAGWNSPHLLPVPQVFGLGQLRDFPLCSTDDLLYVFHRLRC